MAQSNLKQKAVADIAEKVAAAEKLIKEAEQIADTYGIEFDFSVAYGMGGTYRPKRNSEAAKVALAKLTDEDRAALGLDDDEDDDSWNDSGCSEDDEGGWQSSSQSC